MKYYIKDPTKAPSPAYFNSLNELISYLEGFVQRKFNRTRARYMEYLIDLGHGYDDREGQTFTESLRTHVEIGVFNNNKHYPCNVHDATRYGSKKEEMGD